MHKVCVVVPNWNGAASLKACLDSLVAQSVKSDVIVVDNASVDESHEILAAYPKIKVIQHSVNKGFAGGVNAGVRRALDAGYAYIALFNNDAIADKHWLKHLSTALDGDDALGIVAPKIVSKDGKHLDSTGEFYTVWGLPYPRGRGETDIDAYDGQTGVFGASGGASMYRAALLSRVGLFDENFFAYYEDVDISFRAQLAGWKVAFVPAALVRHEIGASSKKVRGFTTYQTMKNLQLLYYKNVPRKYLYRVGWRFTLAHTLFLFKAFSQGNGWTAVKGDVKGSWLLIRSRKLRRHIQQSKKISDDAMWSLFIHDLPPEAHALRKLRTRWWKLTRKKVS